MDVAVAQAEGLDTDWKRDPFRLIHHEAVLIDERRFEEWLDLFIPDGLYWIPGGSGDGTDPQLEISIVYDDDSARRLRIGRLRSGRQFAQEPVSRTCHMISGPEVLDDGEGAGLRIAYNVVVYEARLDKLHTFPGRCTLRLRNTDDGLRIVEKKLVLINRDHYIDNLTFLL